MFCAGKREVRTCRQAFARSPCSFASSWAAAIPEGGPQGGSPRAVLDSDPRGSKAPHQWSAQCGTMFGTRVKSQPSCYLGGGDTSVGLDDLDGVVQAAGGLEPRGDHPPQLRVGREGQQRRRRDVPARQVAPRRLPQRLRILQDDPRRREGLKIPFGTN